MAWNGSDQTSSGAAPRSRGRISPKRATPGEATSSSLRKASPKSSHSSPFLTSHFSLLTSLLLLLALAGAALWYYLRPAPPPPPAQGTKHKAQIAAVTPAPARTNKPAKPAEKKPKLSPTQVMGKRGLPIETYGLKTYWDKGVLRYEGGLRVTDPNRKCAKAINQKTHQIFKRHSLDSIAALVMMTPGDFLTDDVEYGNEFIKDFNDSLFEPIEYDEKDTAYTRQVKDVVKEVQQVLRAKMNEGVDIAQVMNETRQDLRNLFLCRQEILSMVSESTEKAESSDAEVEDVIKAANMMFREKGIREIEEGDIVRWNLILEARREKAEAAAAQGTTTGHVEEK